MTKRKKIALNITIYIALYALLIFLSLLPESLLPEPSPQRGAVKGLAIVVPILLLLFLGITVYFTRKSGGDWNQVKKNIRNNFRGFLLFG